MEQTPHSIGSTGEQQRSYIEQGPALKARTIPQSIFALFVGLPAVLFWMVVAVFIVGILSVLGEEEAQCNVAHVRLHGVVTATDDGLMDVLGYAAITSSDTFTAYVAAAEQDDTVEAILVDINSPGGTPVAADEMMRSLLNAQKPVVAVVRDLGASAAYWVAAGADHIIASPVSDVGSIGVTMSYLETASSTEIEGSRWVDLSSGAFKDAGHPERPLREEEEAFYQGQVDTVHDYMVQQIASAREVFTSDEVAALADGRAYVGTEALQLKLIDALGSFGEARAWVADQLGSSADDVVLCEPYASGWDSLF